VSLVDLHPSLQADRKTHAWPSLEGRDWPCQASAHARHRLCVGLMSDRERPCLTARSDPGINGLGHPREAVRARLGADYTCVFELGESDAGQGSAKLGRRAMPGVRALLAAPTS
jgi:hypothetical protein